MTTAHFAGLVIYWGTAALLTIHAALHAPVFDVAMLISFLMIGGLLGELILIALGVLRPRPSRDR